MSKIKHTVRILIDKFQVICARLCAKSGFLSSVYYTFISTRFYREHKAVLQGRMHFLNSTHKTEKSKPFLRRSIHRLEKGLVMKPRRSVFGTAFIAETVDVYVKNKNHLSEPEGKWSRDVLKSYFEAVDSTPVIDEARALFESVEDTPDAEASYVPYLRSEVKKSGIEYEQFEKLCRQRRSVRWFENREVSPDIIKFAIEAATQAPSACNRQPYSFHVFYGDQARSVGSLPMGSGGFSQNFQCVAAVVGDLSAYPYERDRHVIYIDSSLASMQFMLALETLGLGTCVLNWSDVESLEKKAIRVLGLNEWERPIMFIAIGYPDPEGGIPYSQKKDSSILVRESS